MAYSQQQGHLGGSRLTRASISDPTATTDPTRPASQNQRHDGQSPKKITANTQCPLRYSSDFLKQLPLTAVSESWVEIASQPSSSSLSSIGDEIVTTGLHVGNQSYPPRRRRLQHHYHQSVQQQQMPPSYIVNHAAAQAGTSSQEEYDETESEEDRLMTSSNENVHPRPLPAVGLRRSQTAIPTGADSSDSEDDDEGTALGRPSPTQGFRPQPNAFSHPPTHLNPRSYSSNSAIPMHHPSSRHSPASHRSHNNRVRNDFRSPSYQADRDEALRASLTTLLSCAAAAKSLPGRRGHNTAGSSSGEPVMGAGVGPSAQPMELRLVPESELAHESSPPVGPAAPKLTPQSRQPTTRTTSNSSAQSQPASVSSKEEKGKRTAAAGQSKPQRATKKKRTSASAVDDNAVTWISPTTLTWVVGTGVVLLVSVVGFGAGFVVGREVGRQDILSSTGGSSGGAMSAGLNSTSCGGEVIRSTGSGTLRRWRWGTGMGRSVIA
ncbi:hypothetical protein N0V82_000510 [Gnomoniopsis sp. IMI 355080]|nr:hypothetical protein N0V82_000510 [Gnomoniopsis sp. IMI 355080]